MKHGAISTAAALCVVQVVIIIVIITICCFLVIRLQVRFPTARLVMNLEAKGIYYELCCKFA